MQPAIETFELVKSYPHQRGLADVLRGRHRPDSVALKGVSLTVEQGEVFGLLGPNGSGKTTFLKLLSTILSPTSGTAQIFGHDIGSEARDVRDLVSLVTGEERSLYWRLSARQNLEFFGRLYGLDGRETNRKTDELLELFDLSDVGDLRVAEYSTGMKQRLAIARGLLSSPKLLFLDEPTRGLDPIAAHSLLKGVKERAVDYFANTVILTTHIMREVEQLCRRIAILNRGVLSYQGTTEELRASLERYDVYQLTLLGAASPAVESLRSRAGIERCETEPDKDGSGTLAEISFDKSAISLSDVLRHLLESNVEIARCTKKEQTFEEMFRTIFGSTAKEASPPSA